MAAITSRCFAGALCVCLLLGHFVSAAPPAPSYERLRELYEELVGAGEGYDQALASGPVGSAGLMGLLGGGAGGPGAGGLGAPLSNHQLVRKSNRSPSLRLRYGRRSDPSMKSTWFEQPAVEAGES